VKYKTLEAEGRRGWELILLTATERMTVYYVSYVVISFLGLLVADFFLSLLLLDIIVKNSTTRDVLKSVVDPAPQIFWTLLLVAFVIYIFAFSIFKYYPNEFEYDDDGSQELCETLWHCFLATLFSITQGGGFADTAQFALDERIVLDLAFFIIVMTLLVNVLFGIIIDTFGSLRQKKMARKEATENYCFICGIDKLTFDRMENGTHGGFAKHVEMDHSMWNYLKFIIYIWEQDRDDDDGLEQFVRKSLTSKSLGWLPLRRAMRLIQIESNEERLRREARLEIKKTQTTLQATLVGFQADVGTNLDQLTHMMAEDQKHLDTDYARIRQTLSKGR
jgi:hypothetical protein